MTAPHARTAGLADARNQALYARPDVAVRYRNMDAWVDRGESTVFVDVADEVRGQPILDVGVGGGRTSWWLRLLSRDYVALDYSPEMVAVCRHACPDIDVRLGDARDLSDFEDERFGLVVFSFNGLDSVSHDDRRRVLAEFHRVLRPSGLLIFSTHNRHGPAWGEAPWQTMRYTAAQRPRAERAARLVARMALRPRRELLSYRNWWRLSGCVEDHGDWGTGPGPAYNFGILLHYITPLGEEQELTDTGFDVVDMFTETGQPMKPDDSAPDSFWFYVVARKSGAVPQRPVATL